MIEITASALTDKGLKREKNEDRFLIRTGQVFQKSLGLFVVADGIGGLEYGELASGRVVESFDAWWKYRVPILMEHKSVDEGNILQYIKQDLEILLTDISEDIRMRTKELQISSGTTVLVLVLLDREYLFINVGDSRLYKIGTFGLQMLSQDHTLAYSRYKNGEINKRQWKNYKEKNPLTQCIGISEEINPYIHSGMFYANSRLFLCSDGVYGYAQDFKLTRILQRTSRSNTQQVLESLKDEIYKNGAGDNLTGILVVC